LSKLIKSYERILEDRNRNEVTVDVNNIISNINFKNVNTLLKCLDNKDTVVSYFYYNNLTVEDIVTRIDSKLWLLYTKTQIVRIIQVKSLLQNLRIYVI
jgi:hypothetical protein